MKVNFSIFRMMVRKNIWDLQAQKNGCEKRIGSFIRSYSHFSLTPIEGLNIGSSVHTSHHSSEILDIFVFHVQAIWLNKSN